MKINIKQEQFQTRHLGPDQSEIDVMLKTVGVSSVDELIEQTIPNQIRLQKDMDLPEAYSEFDYLRRLRGVAEKNSIFRTYLGLGYYDTITPNVILRNVFENPGWYTPYTPYQAEIAQGRLEALLNYQTMVSELTGLEIANSSLLDEATAAAEAMAMLYAKRKNKLSDTFFVSEQVYDQTIDVLLTRAEPLGIKIEVGNPAKIDLGAEVFAVLLQYPGESGTINNFRELAKTIKDKDIYLCVAADMMSLVLLTPPGELGADVAIGTTQRFGIPLGYGGPHAAYFATRDEFKRQIPGRIIGVSEDSNGNRALRMALQTREQHIRRDKATSNICTAQALLANMAGFYAVYHGPKGLRQIAERIHGMALALNKGLEMLGIRQENAVFFDTLKINLEESGLTIDQVRAAAEEQEINFRYFGEHFIGISLDETTHKSDVIDILNVFGSLTRKMAPPRGLFDDLESVIPAELLRSDEILTHPVFNSHHSETEMMRYLKQLENKDLGLNTSMISLGSCTMKLNAAAEMIPVSWTEFSKLHPFVPAEQAQGYAQVFAELEHALCQVTGFDAVSLQPNAGAQGEYAGLLVIRAYLHDKGETQRNVVLIPSSAHGTNPASAVMAGMKVVVIACDHRGNIDMDDLKAKCEANKDVLAALMITYPSTHGVFEETVLDVCNMIHEYGGQVYMDGANMNAQVGLTSPGNIGADVCHLNLHKTFCIPHGGGGPGMGPIGVAKHLSPFLPGHKFVKTGGQRAISAVSAAPFSSASILLISHAYIQMMGTEGLKEATRMAILNANYMACRLGEHYDILYKGTKGRVAHEMIVDCRGFKKHGIEVEDIAKRLLDYGFHAPTVSFPVAGTLMIEPTESENLEEIDRFCDALIHIRKEVEEIITGQADAENNVLKNAPHILAQITADKWDFPYSRNAAAFPLPWVAKNKFWPSVGRANNTLGDRNLICTCPPLEEYMEEAPTA